MTRFDRPLGVIEGDPLIARAEPKLLKRAENCGPGRQLMQRERFPPAKPMPLRNLKHPNIVSGLEVASTNVIPLLCTRIGRGQALQRGDREGLRRSIWICQLV